MKRIALLFVFFLGFVLFLSAAQSDNQIAKGQLLLVPPIVNIQQMNAKRTTTTVFDENFETGASGWTSSGSWAVGSPTDGPQKGYKSDNCATMNINGGYSNDTNDWLISPSMTLSDASMIFLYYNEWFALESAYDFGRVKVSTDGGKNWNDVGVCTGKSEWRESTVNLTPYAGQTIKLAFNLTSDHTNTYAGWNIDNVRIETSERDVLSASMTSLNSQDFPYIYMNVAVENDGLGISTLNQSNFTAYENGAQQTNYFAVTPPQTGGGQRLADIVFCLDVTGSMGSEIATAKSNMLSFINALAASSINYRVGFITFGDIYYTYNSHELYANLSDILAITNGIVLGEHGIGNGDDDPENQLGAMADAALFNFRPGAQKVIIMLTDWSSHENDSVTPWTVSTLINNRLLPNNISVFPIFDTNQTLSQTQYIPIAQATNPNGTYYNIYSNFNAIILEIGSYVSDSYVVRYRSSNPVSDGILRNVQVIVSYNGNQSTTSGSYMPGSAPQIALAASTNNLLEQDYWAEGTAFNIDAVITDGASPFVQSARVYYKNTAAAASSYQSVIMNFLSGTTWRGIIPGSAVTQSGLDFYITATDGQTTSSSPAVGPTINPYRFAIWPNLRPTINHIQVTTLIPNHAIVINASVVDNTNNLSSVNLYYRKTGELDEIHWRMVSTGSNNYTATIPSDSVTADGIDYYIIAYDNFGVSTRRPNSNFYLIVEHTYNLGFLPDPHGWIFSNNEASILWPWTWWIQFNYIPPLYPAFPLWPLSFPWDFPDWPLFTHAFGSSQCYYLGIVPKPAAVEKWASIKGEWGGSCYGFAVSSLLNYNFHTEFINKFPNLGAFNNLHDDNMTININRRLCINELFTYQFGKNQLLYRDQNYNKLPVETLNILKNSVATESNNARFLIMYNQRPDGGAHGVVPYKIEKDINNTNIEHIYIYDNNYPGVDTCKVIIDINSNAWSYYLSPSQLWGGSRGLITSQQISNFLNNPILETISNNRYIYYEIYNSNDCDIEFVNSANLSIGKTNGVQVNNLPDGMPIIPITGTEKPAIGYFIPEDQYSILMSNFETEIAHLSIITDNLIYAYSRNDAIPSQQDKIKMGDSFVLSSFDTGNKVVQLKTIKIEDDHEVEYIVNNFSLVQADSISIKCTADNLVSLRYCGIGMGSSIYTLNIHKVGIDGELNFEHLNININHNSTHYFSPNWNNLGTVPIYIDEDNNDSIDDTTYVENQFVDTTLPVELSSFTATTTAQNYVQLTWVSQSESELMGYRVYRNSSNDQATSLLLDQSVIEATNTSTAHSYDAVDNEVEIGSTYFYWLESIDYSGSSNFFGPVSVVVGGTNPPEIPLLTTMKNAYPNPFSSNNQTKIEVSLKAGEVGTVSIYNIRGQSIRSFNVVEGQHTITWDGKDKNGNACSNGVYFYKLTTPTFLQTRKVIYIK